MFFDRWSTKVRLPLGAKWGNNIGGVSACLNWSGGREHKPSLPPNKGRQNNRSNGRKGLPGTQRHIHLTDIPGHPPDDFHEKKPEKRIKIIPWQEDLGMVRDTDGTLKISRTGRGRTDKKELREDVLVGSIKDAASQKRSLPPRPNIGNNRKAITSRLNPPSKGYGFMGPPPARPGARPNNPTPHPPTTLTTRQEVHSTKYTERELIIEDIDDDDRTSSVSLPHSHANRTGSRTGSHTGTRNGGVSSVGGGYYNIPRHSAAYRPQTGTGTGSRSVMYQPEVELNNFSPTPMVWHTHEFNAPIAHAQLLSTHTSKSPLSAARPKTASGSLSRGMRNTAVGNRGGEGGRAAEDSGQKLTADIRRLSNDLQKHTLSRSSPENLTIHVDCSKLVNSSRPGSLTLRLHGVDDANNIKINTVPVK